MKKISKLLTVTIVVAACSSPIETRVQKQFSDRPPAYREGYVEGCHSGKAEAAQSKEKIPKDENRIQSDSTYANGWNDGYVWCRDNYSPSASDARHDPTQPVRMEGGY